MFELPGKEGVDEFRVTANMPASVSTRATRDN